MSFSCNLQDALPPPIHRRLLYPLLNVGLACRLMGMDEQHAAFGHEDAPYLSNVQRPIVVLRFVCILSNEHQPLSFSASYAICNVNHQLTSRKASTLLSTSYTPRRISMRPSVPITRETFRGLFEPFFLRNLDGKEPMHLQRLGNT